MGHFEHPFWLFALIAIPLVATILSFWQGRVASFPQLEKFIDAHLLPYLLVDKRPHKKTLWIAFSLWTVVWASLSFALAGPRFDYRDIETFSRDQSLVILLDLSESMKAADVKPSRLVLAKQKIEDLLNSAKGVKIGLIAFAADPHMITPLTDDLETIRYLLPTLDTDLITVQGSRLSPAFEMAFNMLQGEMGSNHAILVISDGGFEDASAIMTAKKLAEKGIVIHALGVGTAEGIPLKDRAGKVVKKEGVPIVSKLEKDRFSEISKIGQGYYLEAKASDSSEMVVLKELEARADKEISLGKTNRLWEEGFYWMVFPVIPFVVWWLRRGFLLVPLLLFFSTSLQADYFKNSEQRGKEAFEQGDFETARNMFEDPYRRGVACYKGGHFEEAEVLFRENCRAEASCSSLYNLGNALAKQNKFQEAIVAYESVLKSWPDHTHAKENLELLKKLLQDQEKQKQDKSDSDKKEKNENKDQEKNNDQDQKKSDESPKDESPKDESKEEKEEPQDSQPDAESQQEESSDQKEAQQLPQEKTKEDHDADLMLNRITNDPKSFMKNKFYIETKKNGAKEGLDPW